MNARTLAALSLLNELRHAALDTLARKHKHPALLLFYSFIDICASLAEETPAKSNCERFENYLSCYALSSWKTFRPYDLWAARSSLLHAYSPLGDHTDKPNGAQLIFYFVWPETEEQMRTLLLARGYSNFLLVDVSTIKHIAVSSFNGLWMRIENDPEFSKIFQGNAAHLLKDSHYIRLEEELTLLDELAKLREEQTQA